ncbi:hypothetical protein DK317_15770, partial [Listeria monocytogenes]
AKNSRNTELNTIIKFLRLMRIRLSRRNISSLLDKSNRKKTYPKENEIIENIPNNYQNQTLHIKRNLLLQINQYGNIPMF